MALVRKPRGSNTYQVCVTILEAKHLEQNRNPVVVVRVGNRKRRTMVRERTDCPVYNEYFVFDFTDNLDALLSTRITIAVYMRNCLRQLKFYSSILLEVATVWDQPDHQFYHKWAILTHPKTLSTRHKGYVKCNIMVNVKGEKAKVHPETDGEDDIEGNLLMPIGEEVLPFRQKARYIFSIYRADGLPDMTSFCGKTDSKNVNPYIQISFAGMKGSTTVQQQTYAPIFNERIIFREMFPSLCQRVRIAIKHRIDSCRSYTLATYILNLTKVSHSGEYGFLPMFGPSFIHFYTSNSTLANNSCSGKHAQSLPIYCGRVLLSLKTEMEEPEASPSTGVETEPTLAIIEETLWATDEYLLVAILYDVCMIDRRRFMTKSISFEVSLGNAGNRRFSRIAKNNGKAIDEMEGGSKLESQTVPRMTGTLDGKSNYLPIGSRMPCIYVKSWWSNVEWRMCNMNNLYHISNYLETQLEKVEALISVENVEAYKMYNEVVLTLKTYCTRYLHILDGERCEAMGGRTKLDRHRANMCGKKIEGILKRIENNGVLPNNHYIRIAMIHAYQYLRMIQELLIDPQHGLPDIFIWMLSRSKRVAFVRLPAKQVIYSEIGTETGTKCGRRINVFMGNERDENDVGDDYTACKIELFLWLGNAKFATACWSAIPPGYADMYVADHENGHDTFPKYFEYEQTATFQLRAHIFQGRFDAGMDASGLLDPIVRVTFRGYSATTRTIRQSLDPFWDQTLVFPPVTIHGTRETIKQSPPQVVLQVFDQDICGKKEFCGRCIATPLVKLSEETYSPPVFPPKLEWYKFKSQRDCAGSVLAAFELIETSDNDKIDVPMSSRDNDKIFNIPADIRPKMTSYRLEAIFWGVRDMGRIGYIPVIRPRIVIECAGVLVKSEVMNNAKRFCNFEETHVTVDLDMPELDIYYPSVTIKAYDSRGFGCFKYAGICIIPTVYVFLRQLITEQEYMRRVYETKSAQWQRQQKRQSAVFDLPSDFDPTRDESKGLIAYQKMRESGIRATCRKIVDILSSRLKLNFGTFGKKTTYGDDDDETYDWWSKYHASLEEERKAELGVVSAIRFGRKPVATLKIYPSELEVQPQFEGFQDRLRTFDLWKGKKSLDPEEGGPNFAGRFKGHISIYRWPHPDKLPCKTKRGRDVANGLCDDYPSQESVKLLVRVYVVKGINLQPKDPMSGKSDPYLTMKLGKTMINDSKNYIPNQLNPTFGRLFEIEATLPQDYMLTIQVWDYDATSSDDLIGETKIDIENRFYSRHRACCGIAKTYSTSGYNEWRDRERPKQILELLCRKNNLPSPQYRENDVTIGKRKFPFIAVVGNEENGVNREECMALNVLHQWEDFPVCGCALVSEHLERRPLYNSKRARLEQGRLELWIDMFQFGQLPPRPPVDITPQPPEEYEIRAIVWNTEDVPLVESQFLTGERCSDIYVKGWILYEDYQKTDVHYNSLTGEGNFNWRFVFHVTYSRGEHVMIVRQKTSVLARNETEEKLPCRLLLQVWDNDHYSPDDFLGALTLDLTRLPRGSANSKSCTLRLLDPKSPTMNLFKISRTKGWWPFMSCTSDGKCEQAEALVLVWDSRYDVENERGRNSVSWVQGKVELELSVLPATEASEYPAGKGRDPPQNLPPPNRPETSFSWFRNPWKACCFVVCRYYKWRIIFCLLVVLLALLVACGVYAFPGYLVKRIIGA